MEDNTSLGREEIENRFGFHKATVEGPNATAAVHRDIRRLFVELGVQLDALLPAGRGHVHRVHAATGRCHVDALRRGGGGPGCLRVKPW